MDTEVTQITVHVKLIRNVKEMGNMLISNRPVWMKIRENEVKGELESNDGPFLP